MRQLEISPGVIEKTKVMILATKTHECDRACPEIQALLDADMAILGAAPERYMVYCQEIQEEFQSLPSLLYRMGRKKFLQALMNQKSIYHTEWFYDRFEIQARENIRQEITRLKRE